jgi:hypothetical protein
MLFMVTERRAYPPIEGGQSLAEAEPILKLDPLFIAVFYMFLLRLNTFDS